MKRILALLLLLSAPLAAQVSDTCRVYMQLYDYTGAPARYTTLTIKKMVVNGYNITIPPAQGMPQSDASGVVQFRAIKNATVWLYAPVAGLDSAQITGKPIPLSNAAAQWIVPTTTASVPARYVVSIADLWAGKGATVGYIDTLLFSGAGVTVTKSFGTLTVDLAAATGVTVQLLSDSLDRNPRGGGGTAVVTYGDSIRVADSLARLARDIANGKLDSDSLAAVRDTARSANLAAASALGQLAGKVSTAALTDSLNKLPRSTITIPQLTDSLNLREGSVRSWVGLQGYLTGYTESDPTVHDSLALRALAVGDSLLAIRGWTRLFVRTEIKDSLNTIVRTEVDPTATAKAQTAIRDTIDAKFPRTGIATLTSIRDSISALTTGGVRGISSTARIFVSDDSLTLTVAPNETVNCALGNVFRTTLTRNDTLGVANMVDGQIVSIIITNAATYTLAWTGVNWAGGTAPTLSAVANKRDVFTLIQAGGIVYGSAVQDLR